MERQSKSETRQFERCIRCGKETEYTTDTPVALRYCFVDGAGQLCRECYAKLNDRKAGDNEALVSNE